jgi:hypothetical protein
MHRNHKNQTLGPLNPIILIILESLCSNVGGQHVEFCVSFDCLWG